MQTIGHVTQVTMMFVMYTSESKIVGQTNDLTEARQWAAAHSTNLNAYVDVPSEKRCFWYADGKLNHERY